MSQEILDVIRNHLRLDIQRKRFDGGLEISLNLVFEEGEGYYWQTRTEEISTILVSIDDFS